MKTLTAALIGLCLAAQIVKASDIGGVQIQDWSIPGQLTGGTVQATVTVPSILARTEL